VRTLTPVFGWLVLTGNLAAAGPGAVLPRFTEEREAAALYFTRKHLPELLPLLTELKKSNVARYQREVSEIFQVTESLADLQDNPRRHELELKIWKAENRSHVLVGRLRVAAEEDIKKLKDQLREVARRMADLGIQVLELQAEQVETELAEIKDELTRARDQVEQNARARYERLLEKAKK
jgi:hypothetical protein